MHNSLLTIWDISSLSLRLTTNIQFPWLFSAALGLTNIVRVGHTSMESLEARFLRLLREENSNSGFTYLVLPFGTLLVTECRRFLQNHATNKENKKQLLFLKSLNLNTMSNFNRCIIYFDYLFDHCISFGS